METTTTEAVSVAKALQEEAHGIGDQRKTTETVARSTLATVYACTVAGNRFPAKFGCQPIKLQLYPLAHAYPANYVRVHVRHLGVYKESRVAAEPFRLGLAKV